MLADACLHSASAALHCIRGSGSAAPVPVTNASQDHDILFPRSGGIAVGT